MAARALINIPKNAKRGDIIEKFVCTYNGEVVFSAELHPAIAANPFISFTTIATDSGAIIFAWTDNHGETQVQTARIDVA